MHAGEIAGHGNERGERCCDEGQTHLACQALNDYEGECQHEPCERKRWPKTRERRRAGLFREAGKRGRMSSNAQQQEDDDRDNWRLYATRKGQRRYCCGAEVKADGNELGDRNHLIALI
jgi:hypothetical protein